MSIWHPLSGVTYDQYLQANSFVRDMTGNLKSVGKSLRTRISDQTRTLVASNQQLAASFGNGFDSVNNTLVWGFGRVEHSLQDVAASVDSLHADFDYTMGLLLDELRSQNRLLNELLNKLDAIQKTLENPTLTQAREFYRIGCERLSKGLLDKALDAFLEADKRNDTDFFTQYQIGNLYLYGIDEYTNLVDFAKAKRHLLLAVRYAKVEMRAEPEFGRWAAEALFHASVAVYASLGSGNASSLKDHLKEARQFASEASTLNPHLAEAFYHVSKYSALLNDPSAAMGNLESAIAIDRNYAVKVDIDHAFDSVRLELTSFIEALTEKKRSEATLKLEEANRLLQSILATPTQRTDIRVTFSQHWNDRLRQLLADMEKIKGVMQASEIDSIYDVPKQITPLIVYVPAFCSTTIEKARTYIATGTFFGYSDAVANLDSLISLALEVLWFIGYEINYIQNKSRGR